MTLLSSTLPRLPKHNHLVGASTATVAGLVNVASVMAFFAFASNMTGHVAVLAEELVNGHFHQVTILLFWLLLFATGAGGSGYVVELSRSKPQLARWTNSPLIIELILLASVGYYGTTVYQETLRETEMLIAALIFAMGLQNGFVTSISKGVVKTTHLTGLLTDLGVELAQIVNGESSANEDLRVKIKLRLLILGFYIGGGLAGGLMFREFGFITFYLGSGILIGIIGYDHNLKTVKAEPQLAATCPLKSPRLASEPNASFWTDKFYVEQDSGNGSIRTVVPRLQQRR